MGIYTDIDYGNYDFGAQIGARSAGLITIGDYPSWSRAPFYLEAVNLAPEAKMMRLFAKGGGKMAPAKKVGDDVYYWPEYDSYPTIYETLYAASNSETSLNFTELAGLRPMDKLKNLNTGEIVIIINWQEDSGAFSAGTTPPTQTQLADSGTSVSDATGVEVIRGYGNTSAVAITVGDRWVKLATAAEEGGMDTWGTGIHETRRSQMMFDARFPWEISAHAKAVNRRNGGISWNERRAMEIQHAINSLEGEMLFGEASSSTLGTGATVTNAFRPNYSNVGALSSPVVRSGEGIIAQVETHGYTYSFGGSFSLKAMNEVIYEISRKNGAKRKLAVCGHGFIDAINDYHDKLVTEDDFTRQASQLFSSNITSIRTTSDVIVDLMPHDLFSAAGTENPMYGAALVLDPRFVFPVTMEGMDADWEKVVTGIQPNARWSEKEEIRFTGSIAVANGRAHALLLGAR